MPADKYTITITATDRPDLFRDMLNSLVACDLDGWHVHVSIEPLGGEAEIATLCQSILPDGQYSVRVNDAVLGVRGNPEATITRAFDEGSTFNLCLEDDFLLAPDALQLAKWYVAHHQPHWVGLNLLAGNCGSAGNLSDLSEPKAVFETRCFNSIGVGMTRDDWARMRGCWQEPDKQRLKRTDKRFSGWDWSFLVSLVLADDARVVQPAAARCTHTGAIGTHCRPEFQEKAFARLQLCERPLQADPTSAFTLLDHGELPYRTAAHLYTQTEVSLLRREIMMRSNIMAAADLPDLTHREELGGMASIRQKLTNMRAALTTWNH